MTNVQTRYFIVTWKKPKDGGYYQVQNYTIEIKTELAKNFTIVEILPYSQTGLMIKDLEPATEYTIRVSSNNKYGISDGILVTQSTLKSKRQIDRISALIAYERKLYLVPGLLPLRRKLKRERKIASMFKHRKRKR